MTAILAAISWLKNSWLGKAVGVLMLLAALWGGKKLYDRKQQNIGVEKKTKEDLKKIGKMVEAQKDDAQRHQHLEGDELEKELLDQQKEFQRR